LESTDGASLGWRSAVQRVDVPATTIPKIIGPISQSNLQAKSFAAPGPNVTQVGKASSLCPKKPDLSGFFHHLILSNRTGRPFSAMCGKF